MDLSKYLDLFVSESRNHIRAFDELIVSLEQNSGDPGIINDLFRHVHSLKGMAATMQFDSITELSHAMEELLSKIRNGQFTLSAEMTDVLLEGNDLLSAMVSAIESSSSSQQFDTSALVKRLTYFTAAPATVVETAQTATQPPGKTDHAGDTAEHQFRQVDVLKSIRIKTDTLDRLVNITGELFTTRHQLAECTKNIPGGASHAPMKQLSTLLRELRDVVLQARMLPFSHVSERFPRLVRDLARSLGKEVEFEVVGKEIELDRGVLEEITEPLIHILRNAVDHGLEPVGQRLKSGKAAQGRILVSLLRDKDHVTISVSDDGRGMDPQHLAEQAVNKGIISREKAAGLSPHEAFQLICTPGFSTAATVSSVSGRGVGMDAVKSAIHNLGGTMTIDSRMGQGSIFLLKLPVSVSIIHALLVEYGGQIVALPVNTVDRTLELQFKDIYNQGDGSAFNLMGQAIPLHNLDRFHHPARQENQDSYISVVLSGLDATPFGVAVDRIIGQQEIFVKPLGRPLNQLHHCTGGSIAGDGSIVFVMDVNALK